jgi:hypothetical protein
MHLIRVLLLSAVVLLPACVDRDRPPPPSDEDLRAIAQNTLAQPPRLQRKVEAELEGRVAYLGLEVDKDPVRPGELLKLTHYWRSLRAVEPGWEIFVSLVDPSGRTVPADHVAIGGRHPAARWKPGQVIRDRHTVALPADWRAPTVAIHVGLRKGSEPRKVSRGPGLGADHVLAATLRVGLPRSASPRVMQIVATRAAEPPMIDGKLEDEVWGKSAASDPLRTASGAKLQRTTARVAWAPAGLYLGFESDDTEIVSTISGCADAPGKGDLVGVLLGIGEQQLSLVLSPCGKLCLQRGPSTGARPKRPGSGERWSTSQEIRSALVIDGTLNGGDRDRSWTAELAIPWGVFAARGWKPVAGGIVRVNFYRIEAPGKSPTIAWSPRESLLPDGELQLGDEQGNSVEPPAPKPATPATR